MKFKTITILWILIIFSCSDNTPHSEKNPSVEQSNQATVKKDTIKPTTFSEIPHLAALHKSRQSPPPLSAWDKARIRLKEMLHVDAPIQGIDVSKWQYKVDWEDMNVDQLSFAICKATEGAMEVDDYFQKNWEGLQTIGMVRGAYHFYMYPVSPEKQAQHFLRTIGTLENHDLPLILDIEGGSIGHQKVNKAQLVSDLLKFLEIVENTTKRRPMIYTNIPFANRYMYTRRFAKYPLWISLYEDYQSPHLPAAWKSSGWEFWQKSDSDRVEGVQTKVDFDVFNGDRADFEAFFKENLEHVE